MALPDPSYQNSAGRLLSILTTVPNGRNYLDLIPALFGMNPKTNEEKQQACIAGLLEIHKLYLEFCEDMNTAQISDQQRKVLRAGLTSIQQSIYPTNLHSQFRSLTDAEKSLLEVAATVIAEETPIPKEDVDAIRASITQLRTLVESADIQPSLRKVLLDLIRMSEDALARFNIYGARGLRRAYKAMLAEAIEAYGVATRDRDANEVKSSAAWTAIVNHLDMFDAVASRLLKYQPVLEKVTYMLLGSPQA